MNQQEKLIQHLRTKGKTHSWRELAEMYDILPGGTSKQRSDKVRKLSHSLAYPTATIQESKKINLPESTIYSNKVDSSGMHIILGCVHIPFHNKILLDKLCRFLKDYKHVIKGFHIIGDFLDLYSLSKHNYNNVKLQDITLGFEYREGNKVLDKIQNCLPNDCVKTFIYGNHEARFFTHVSDINNTRYADALISPDIGLNLSKRGFSIFYDWKEDYVQLGPVQLIHGIFYNTTAAKTHLTKLKSSVVFAHTHRIDSYREGSLEAHSLGCFADIESEGFKYKSRVERVGWSNGFGIIHLDKDKTYQIDIINCKDNTFYYAGTRY